VMVFLPVARAIDRDATDATRIAHTGESIRAPFDDTVYVVV